MKFVSVDKSRWQLALQNVKMFFISHPRLTRNGAVALYFFVCTYFMCYSQYKLQVFFECEGASFNNVVLYDFGFEFLSPLEPLAKHLNMDYWVTGTTLTSLVRMCFIAEKKDIVFRRLFFIAGTIYAIRGFTIAGTVLPNPYEKCETYIPSTQEYDNEDSASETPSSLTDSSSLFSHSPQYFSTTIEEVRKAILELVKNPSESVNQHVVSTPFTKSLSVITSSLSEITPTPTENEIDESITTTTQRTLKEKEPYNSQEKDEDDKNVDDSRDSLILTKRSKRYSSSSTSKNKKVKGEEESNNNINSVSLEGSFTKPSSMTTGPVSTTTSTPSPSHVAKEDFSSKKEIETCRKRLRRSGSALYHAFMIFVRQESTCYDCMFSGHTCIMLICSFLWELYTNNRALKIASRLNTLLFCIFLVASHYHYTDDVLLGLFVTLFIHALYYIMVSASFLVEGVAFDFDIDIPSQSSYQKHKLQPSLPTSGRLLHLNFEKPLRIVKWIETM